MNRGGNYPFIELRQIEEPHVEGSGDRQFSKMDKSSRRVIFAVVLDGTFLVEEGIERVSLHFFSKNKRSNASLRFIL